MTIHSNGCLHSPSGNLFYSVMPVVCLPFIYFKLLCLYFLFALMQLHAVSNSLCMASRSAAFLLRHNWDLTAAILARHLSFSFYLTGPECPCVLPAGAEPVLPCLDIPPPPPHPPASHQHLPHQQPVHGHSLVSGEVAQHQELQHAEQGVHGPKYTCDYITQDLSQGSFFGYVLPVLVFSTCFNFPKFFEYSTKYIHMAGRSDFITVSKNCILLLQSPSSAFCEGNTFQGES